MTAAPGARVAGTPQFWWRVAIIVVCLLGLSSGNHRLVFFTTQSNVIVFAYFAGALYWMLRRGTTDAPAPRLRGATTAWILTTALVSHVLLNYGASPLPGLFVTDPAEALANRSLFILHYVVPGMVLVDWLAFGPRRAVRWRDGLVWLLYPFLYGVITLARAIAFPTIADRFPYPFLNIDYLGIGGALLGLLQVVAVIAVVGAIVIGLDRAVAALSDRRRRARTAPGA
ncbi:MULTISPECIES: Pr6Pr family membrane protein [unclassified Microbacterium]|uniref:Pr6Pr family membrane protein n=1 Tax=unclassified Microbacterium TaxID=2609290 RepID=UPI00214AAC34|nr:MULTISPECIES: Pr6Pr family membrane protein [unclassified Microbacterium]MCR2785839.1 Pr6Pr family membrane protein [Microbacterium sp. zg.B96]WIM17182.1 Pr6Pr family membrane protein [Microbacterium sp. zg-B96]